MNYVTNSRKSVHSKVILFLIASDWWSPIIVSNPFYIQFLKISSVNVIA